MENTRKHRERPHNQNQTCDFLAVRRRCKPVHHIIQRKETLFPQQSFHLIISPLPVHLITVVNSETLLLSFHLGLLTAVTHRALEQTQAANRTARVSKSVFFLFFSFFFLPWPAPWMLGPDVLVRRKSCRNFAGCWKPPESLESGLSLRSQPTGEQSRSD